MWIPILSGLAVGLAALIVIAFLKDRRYRMLFSDVHLRALGEALAAAGKAGPGALQKTFAGVSLEWRALKLHAGLVVTPGGRLAPEAVRFLLGVLAAAMARAPVAAIVIDGKRYGLVVAGDVAREVSVPEERAAFDAWRTAGVEAMKNLPLVPGALEAWM